MRQFVGGLQVAQQLAQANIIANKNPIPSDRTEDWDRPGGLRMGTIEIARILVERAELEAVRDDVIAFRQPYQTLYYCFEHGFPIKAWRSAINRAHSERCLLVQDSSKRQPESPAG